MEPLSETNRLFLRHVAQTSPNPLSLEIVKAEGHYLYDSRGKAYLDLIGGISVCNTGHRHPRVVQAVKDQTDRYFHLLVYGELIQSPQVCWLRTCPPRWTPFILPTAAPRRRRAR
jgi:acetylornithine/N-succinyldiaminopimelate aminotransferase